MTEEYQCKGAVEWLKICRRDGYEAVKCLIDQNRYETCQELTEFLQRLDTLLRDEEELPKFDPNPTVVSGQKRKPGRPKKG